jgi:hypothetical protein
MTVCPAASQQAAYAINEKALRAWATHRLRRERRAGGGTSYSFTISGSTCNNMGIALEVVMTVDVGADGRIEAACCGPAATDGGCDAMCAAGCNAPAFFAHVGGCAKVVGLTLTEAAFMEWEPETSGCFCTDGNRRHKWRNAFQVLHYAVTHPDVG